MMINFAVSFLHQYLPPTVLRAYLPLLLQTLTWNPLFPEEAISEIAHTFLLLFPSISHDIFMGLCFCISASDWADILLRFLQMHSDIPGDLFQSCFVNPHGGWIPGKVCLAQCPTAAAKSSSKGSCVIDLINVSATSLKTFFFSFPVIFLPSGFLQCTNDKQML